MTQVFVDVDTLAIVGTRGHASGTLHYEPKIGPRVKYDFSAHVAFDAEGRIRSRRDYWDTAAALRHALLHG